MAEKKTYADVLGENKIGTYQEAAGGGTGSNKNFHVAKDQEEADAYKQAHPGAAVRVNQPRDENGQFTYNSANAKPLEYGPSRGKTVPPFLKNVKITYAVKKGDKIVSEENDKKYVYVVNSDFNLDELVETFKEFKGEGGFGKFSEIIKKKKGKKSNLEKATSGTTVIDSEKKVAATSTVLQEFFAKHQKVKTVHFAAKKKEAQPSPAASASQPEPTPKAKPMAIIEPEEKTEPVSQPQNVEPKKNIPEPPKVTGIQKEIGEKQYSSQNKDKWNLEEAKTDFETFAKNNASKINELTKMAKDATGKTLKASVLQAAILKLGDFDKVKAQLQLALSKIKR